MKNTLLIILFLITANAYSQDKLKLKKIDSLVNNINTSNFPVQHDSILQDHPELGLKMKTFLTMISQDTLIMKYVNKVDIIKVENGHPSRMITSSSFYFSENNLIKVEESASSDKEGKTIFWDWYYSENKPLYYTNTTEKAEERAKLLLSMSKDLVLQIQKGSQKIK